MPDYTLDTHTKPHGLRVGIFENPQFPMSAIVFTIGHRLTDMLPSVGLCAVREHIANGVARMVLPL